MIAVATRFARILRAGALAAVAALTIAPAAWAQNLIQAENSKTSGVTSAWWIPDSSYASNREIEGYASASSVNRGGSINLFVQTNGASSYTIEIYRIGWYGGAGGRLVAGPISRSRTQQPGCQTTDSSAKLVECNWTDPYRVNVPSSSSDWTSGVYLVGSPGTELEFAL